MVGATATLVLLAGCSSGSSTPGSANAGGGEETKGADQIYADALNALSREPSIHLSVSATDASGAVTRIEADLTADAARLLSTDSVGATTIVVVGGRSYAKQGGGFVELPAEVNAGLQALTKGKALSCSRVEHGMLTKGPITTLKGHRVITLQDDGKHPGDAPGSALVAIDGPPLLVRTVTTGPETPGGSVDCGHSPSSSTVSQQVDYDYSRGAVTITAPPVSAPQSA